MKKVQIKFSIRLKYILFIIALILLISLISAYLTIHNQTSTLRTEIIERARIIVRTLAKDSKEAILTKDDLTLFTSMETVMQEKGILYAMVLNEKRIPIAHNDTKYLTEHKYQMNDPVTKKAFQAGKVLVQDIINRGEAAFDVSAPIPIKKGKMGGIIRLGLSKEPIKQAVKKTSRQIIMITIVVLFLGVIFTVILTSYIISPIKILMDGVERISEGNLDKAIRIKQKDEFLVLANTFNDMQKAIKKMMKEIAEKEAIKKELQIASSIQKMLIPKRSPAIEGFDLAGFTMPAAEVGGDYFDFFHIDQENYGTIIADVTGHGISSALIMVMVRTIFKTSLKDIISPPEILSLANRLLAGDILSDRFVTMIFFTLNFKNKTINFSNAGHLPLLWYNAKDNKIHEILDNGFPIGVVEKPEYKKHKITLKKDDMVIMYTDGFVEIKNSKEEQFGMERFKELIVKYKDLDSQGMIKKILDESDKFSKLKEQDDKTIIILKTQR
ncbi:MAG: SpoIIE family protein phosphatase [Spirochaetes bacterium]|nr:SpoIIE family protein phosphatase [Spirochaetota bacterium]